MDSAHQPTVKDIARRLGVAPSTVSRSLNDHPGISEETKAKVMALAEEMGYVRNLSARLMRKVRNFVVGLVIPDIRNSFYSMLASVLAAECRLLSYQVILGITDDNPQAEKEQVQAMVEARVAGIIIAPSPDPLESTIRLLRSIPTVQMLRHRPAIGDDAVCMQDAAGIRAATRHLLQLGHRRIAYVGTRKDVSTGAGRLKGYIDAYEAAAITPDESLIKLMPPREYEAEQGVSELLAMPDRPSAVIMGSSIMSVGGMRGIIAAGLRIPEDISFVGYGNPTWCSVAAPPVTAISLPIRAIASGAVHRIFAAIDGEPSKEAFHKPKPVLIVRSSTAPFAG